MLLLTVPSDTSVLESLPFLLIVSKQYLLEAVQTATFFTSLATTVQYYGLACSVLGSFDARGRKAASTMMRDDDFILPLNVTRGQKITSSTTTVMPEGRTDAEGL